MKSPSHANLDFRLKNSNSNPKTNPRNGLIRNHGLINGNGLTDGNGLTINLFTKKKEGFSETKKPFSVLKFNHYLILHLGIFHEILSHELLPKINGWLGSKGFFPDGWFVYYQFIYIDAKLRKHIQPVFLDELKIEWSPKGDANLGFDKHGFEAAGKFVEFFNDHGFTGNDVFFATTQEILKSDSKDQVNEWKMALQIIAALRDCALKDQGNPEYEKLIVAAIRGDLKEFPSTVNEKKNWLGSSSMNLYSG